MIHILVNHIKSTQWLVRLKSSAQVANRRLPDGGSATCPSSCPLREGSAAGYETLIYLSPLLSVEKSPSFDGIPSVVDNRNGNSYTNMQHHRHITQHDTRRY